MKKILIDFLISIKNSSISKKEYLKVYYNKHFVLLLKILYKEGLIQDFWTVTAGEKPHIIILLKYHYNITAYNFLKVVSKPSKQVLFSLKDIFKLYEKQILYIFSTSKGFLTSLECKQKKIGGILVFYVK